jgi:hypothetical protein
MSSALQKFKATDTAIQEDILHRNLTTERSVGNYVCVSLVDAVLPVSQDKLALTKTNKLQAVKPSTSV